MLLLPLIACLAPPAFPTTTETLDGWTLYLEAGLEKDHPMEWQSARRELDKQLYQITRVIPNGPLEKLKQIPIWINVDDQGTKCMAFHPGAEYLSQHRMNPKMAGGIEIGNLNSFVSWTYEQPWMVLHELAHGYHFRFTDRAFDNPAIKAAFDAAMKAKLYDSVLHWDAKTVKHYAETNQMEYFAESTEAYFGQNDFYPFVNAELKTYDPVTFELMRHIWGDPQKRP